MRTLAVVLGVLVLGALVVLAVAGVSAATAVLVTVAAILAMIVLGTKLGARHTPDRAPYRPEAEDQGPAGAAGR
ncbi:MAG TPA: hypothetical protein VMB72_12045 [Acidimicrobiales bacterium]|nr:hypothetical protein [Acidimicrobiales bacterium]